VPELHSLPKVPYGSLLSSAHTSASGLKLLSTVTCVLHSHLHRGRHTHIVFDLGVLGVIHIEPQRLADPIARLIDRTAIGVAPFDFWDWA
jgi:hypothetical protein